MENPTDRNQRYGNINSKKACGTSCWNVLGTCICRRRQNISETRGIISETDGKESFALLTEDGEELVLTITKIKSFKKSNSVSAPDIGATPPQVRSTIENSIASSTEAREIPNITAGEPKLSPEIVKLPVETAPVPHMIDPFFRVEVQKAHYKA